MTKLTVAFRYNANAPEIEHDDSNHNACEFQTGGRRFETRLEQRSPLCFRSFPQPVQVNITILASTAFPSTSFSVHYSMNIYHTYLLTPCSTVLLEKLTGFAASQEIPRIYGIRKFITVHVAQSFLRS
jgi:hypothetical protein